MPVQYPLAITENETETSESLPDLSENDVQYPKPSNETIGLETNQREREGKQTNYYKAWLDTCFHC